jgi:hypothetical protein
MSAIKPTFFETASFQAISLMQLFDFIYVLNQTVFLGFQKVNGCDSDHLVNAVG